MCLGGLLIKKRLKKEEMAICQILLNGWGREARH